MTTYNYSMTWALSASKLHSQIEKKDFPQDFQGITADKTQSWYDVKCFFDADLSASDKTQLDGVMSSHDATPDTSEDYIIYDNIETDTLKVNKKIAPKDINYDILGLHKDSQVWDDGYLSVKNYWKDYDETTKTYSNLAVKEELTYIREGQNLVKREKDIKWYKKNGTESDPKVTKKYYSFEEGMRSDKKARSNIIEKTKKDTSWLIMQTEWIAQEQARVHGEAIIHEFIIEISEYIEGNKQPLIDAITNYDTQWGTQNAWIDNSFPDGQWGSLTIRQHMLYRINR